MVTAADDARMEWTPGRIAGLVVFTAVIAVVLFVAGRALLASDEDPVAGIAEQAVFQRLLEIPVDADVLIEPAWAATFYGSVLIRPDQVGDLLPGGDRVAGGGDANDPAFSYQEYTIEGEWTCLAYADIHDVDHPSPLMALEQLEAERRAAIESGERVLANVGAICGTEEQFPGR
jgi:hypothetical protein